MTSEKPTAPELREKRALTQELDMKALAERAKMLTPEQIREKVALLNRKVKLTGVSHEVEVAVDPSIHTWACARVPKKQVRSSGDVVETNYFHYIIVLPYEHLAIEDEAFVLGELRHELGHALYTDWQMNGRLSELAQTQGYPAENMGSLLNCLEDPRMERVSTMPARSNGYVKDWFWAKNKTFILPNIGNAISEQHPVSQFDFLIKLYSLWQNHAQNAEAENIEPWDGINNLHPKVQELWGEIKDELEKIVGVGAYSKPESRAYAIERSIRDIFWPAKKKLIDEFGQAPGEDQKSSEGSGENDQPGNPDDIENLSPEVQKLINGTIEQYKKAIEQQQQQQIEHNKKAEEENQLIKKKQHERQQKTDGIRSPEARKQYVQLKKDSVVVEKHMRRLFEKYFPKIAFPRDTHGRRGKKYNMREHLKRYGTGLEKPMATPNTPEKSGFILQLIVDISGSMSGKRIEEAVKTTIGVLEAAQEYPIYIEILASDDKNCDSDGIDRDKYVLKAFNEDFGGASGGRIKERLVATLSHCGSGNDDVASIRAAIPRIERQKKRLAADYEKLAVLTIFLSDAEIAGQQDPQVVNELRRKVPILGGCIEPDASIKAAVEAAYGPIGEGSFCPDSLAGFPQTFEKILRKKIRNLFRT